jgi:hypothetical protein
LNILAEMLVADNMQPTCLATIHRSAGKMLSNCPLAKSLWKLTSAFWDPHTPKPPWRESRTLCGAECSAYRTLAKRKDAVGAQGPNVRTVAHPLASVVFFTAEDRSQERIHPADDVNQEARLVTVRLCFAPGYREYFNTLTRRAGAVQ